MMNLINAFQQVFIFLSFSPELSTKEPQVTWTMFKGPCVENGFQVSAVSYSNIKKPFSKDSNEDKQQTVKSTGLDLTRHTKSGLPNTFMGEMKVYSLHSTVLQWGE